MAEKSPTDAEVMDWLVKNACHSADSIAIGFQGTPAEKTRAVIRRGLEALIANGLITIKPVNEWPGFYIPDPPYKNPFSKE